MADLKWKELAKALFLAGFFGYLTIALISVVWVGFLVFAGFGWLFYDLDHKIAMARKIFSYEFRKEFGGFLEKILSFAGDVKAFYWDNNGAKITTIAALFVVYAFMRSFCWYVDHFFGRRDHFDLGVAIAVYALCFLFSSLCALLGNAETAKPFPQLTDKKVLKAIARGTLWLAISIIWHLPIFFAWRLPKFLIKTIILTVRAVHSRELVAVSLYACIGMIYATLFPPFALPPAQVFLMALGCGVFTGAAGLGVHKVLLTVSAQQVFEWAEGL